MIAEIAGKTTREADRAEDELTGNFFGSLRYIPFNKGLKRILKSCLAPNKFDKIIDLIDAGEWSESIHFWQQQKYEGEPDILLDFDDVIILIEVKYNSGLSPGQLERYEKLLNRIANGKETLIILLAREEEAGMSYDELVTDKEQSLLNVTPFGYMTWQKVYDTINTLREDGNLNQFEKLIMSDIYDLLGKKGFEGFRNFDVGGLTVDRHKVWRFYEGSESQEGFSFVQERKIIRGLHYVFG